MDVTAINIQIHLASVKYYIVGYLQKQSKMPEGNGRIFLSGEKEKVRSLQMQGITGSNITVLELVERYLSLKTGVKHNTLANYKIPW